MKPVPLTIIIAALIVSGAIMLSSRPSLGGDTIPAVDNVSTRDGVQYITISARGGYSPLVTSAVAGIPTVVTVATQNTFDCSAALTIPSLGFREILPSTGSTEIRLPAQEAGAVVRGLCSMGMYSFEIRFN